jgi:hypothetical protein
MSGVSGEVWAAIAGAIARTVTAINEYRNKDTQIMQTLPDWIERPCQARP